MPPTWTVISFIHIRYDVNLLLIALIGALSSSMGRLILSKITYRSSRKVLSEKSISSMSYLGKAIKKRPNSSFFVTLFWALSPFGSNYLFIAIGLAKSNLRYTISGFLTGRTISYFLLAYTAGVVYENIYETIVDKIWSLENLIINIVGLLTMYLYIALDWKLLFTEKKIRLNLKIIRT